MGYPAGVLIYSPGPWMGYPERVQNGYRYVSKRGNMYYYPIIIYYYININIGANIFHHPYGYPDMQVYSF